MALSRAQAIIARTTGRQECARHEASCVDGWLAELTLSGPFAIDYRVEGAEHLVRTAADEAANACLEMYTRASFPVGGKKRIHGLRLTTTDTGWSYGAGPEVSGPALSLLLAMTGRPAGLKELSGDGAPVLSQRLTASAA